MKNHFEDEYSYIILSAPYVSEYQQKIYCLNINLWKKLKLIKKVFNSICISISPGPL